MKVFIITEGSSYIGFGHITRMLSIYQAFEEINIKPKLIINGDESILDLVENTDFEIYDWLHEKENLLSQIKDADIVIVDSYMADKDFYEKISNIVKIPVYYDDNKRLDYPKGIVVNGNIYAKDLDYPNKEGTFYLLGTQYTPLRKEFWEVSEKSIKKSVESIMITFGGDDIRNMTPKVLKLLKAKFPNLKKNVVIGKGFKNINEIEYTKDANTDLIYFPKAEKMKELMLESDIAISAGGQTLYELARVGVPTIAVVVADNQHRNVMKFEELGLIENAGWWDNENILEVINYKLNNLFAFNIREEKAKKMREAMSNNKIEAFVSMLIKFRYGLQ